MRPPTIWMGPGPTITERACRGGVSELLVLGSVEEVDQLLIGLVEVVRHPDLTVQETELELGPREWTVLEYLLINAPKPASKDKLLQALTGWDREITPNAVEVYISRLRGKLEPHGVALRSIRGFGYRLELAPQ